MMRRTVGLRQACALIVGVLTSGTLIRFATCDAFHSLLLEDFDVLIVQPEKDGRN
jgi:hypothetical protein